MALSDVSLFKGIKNLTVYDRDTRVPKYILRVVSDVKIDQKTEYDELKVGGTVWHTDIKDSSVDLSFTAFEYPVDVVEHLTGGISTDYTSQSNGEIIDEENVNGDSILDSATGMDVQVDSATKAQQKFCEYVVKAKTASTVSLYAMSSVSFNEGNDKDFSDDTMLVADDISIGTGSGTLVTDFGIKFVGGSGTIGFTVGDTARFRVRPASTTGYKVVVGGLNSSFEDVGVIAFPRKINSEYSLIDMYKVKISGMPLEFKDGGYSSYQITAKLQYDSDKEGLYEIVRNG
jgi:hypothetical protein